MAEDPVSQDQQRADMAELRLELANTLASLDKRTELIAQDLIALRREMTDRFEQMDQHFEQAERQRAEDRQAIMQQFQQVDQQFSRHETRLVNLENWMRTIFVTVALVAIEVAAQLFYTLLKFGLQPSTP